MTMVYVTGIKLNETTFKMHSPKFPYTSTTYCGYNLEEMKKRYREKNNLVGKHVEWIILGEG